MPADQHPTPPAWSEPAGLNPRGTLLVIPGRGEQPAVYERLARRISADAYRVRVLHDPTSDAAVTLAQVAGQLRDPDSALPQVLLGSDTGALYAAALAASGQADQADGLILAGLPTSDRAAPSPRSWDDELDSRTSCPTHRGVLTRSAVWPGALFDAVPAAWFEQADLSRVKQPVLGIHGAADPISPLADARERYQRAPAAQLVSIADGRHDALNDLTHRTVAATIVLFLERLRLGRDLPAIATSEQLQEES
jgi:alpha-beta hydrolase superfamily lysophospholipase